MVRTIRRVMIVRKLLILHRGGEGGKEGRAVPAGRCPTSHRAPFSITTAEPRNPLTSPSISPLERSYFGDFYWAWEDWEEGPPP